MRTGLTEAAPQLRMLRSSAWADACLDLESGFAQPSTPWMTAVGIPFPDTKMLAPNQPGMLCVSGPQVMKGYWGTPAETVNVLHRDQHDKIWLHTGDVAVMSEDGYFSIVDRKKDRITAAGGFKICPREVEDVPYEHPRVMEGAVIGLPTGGSDQRARAFIALHTGQSATRGQILTFCHQRLAPYKAGKYIVFRNDLPRNDGRQDPAAPADRGRRGIAGYPLRQRRLGRENHLL